MSLNTPMSYAARRSCGCIVAAVADQIGQEKNTTKVVAIWIEQGYRVTHMETEEIRYSFGCVHASRQLELPLTSNGKDEEHEPNQNPTRTIK
ncbi:MAG: hypothetical protein A2Z04_06670 [Chloroflexi bacterium RBG_16_57_9]|nr:MAG: hypothetical protein A2Z04_06670 [Chloroflexi bacterium RBG_16_57_9]